MYVHESVTMNDMIDCLRSARKLMAEGRSARTQKVIGLAIGRSVLPLLAVALIASCSQKPESTAGDKLVGSKETASKEETKRPASHKSGANTPTEAKSKSPEANSAYKEGIAYLHELQLRDAVGQFSKAIEHDPKFAEAYCGRAYAHNKLGEYSETILDCDDALKINPKMAWALSHRAMANYRMGRFESAIQDASRAIEISPTWDDAYFNRADAYIELGKSKEALADLERGIELNPSFARDPRNGWLFVNKAICQDALGDFQSAIESCNMALDKDKYNREALRIRAKAYSRMGQHLKSVEDYSLVISLDPKDVTSLRNRASEYNVLGQYEKAADDCTKALELDGSSEIAYNTRADAYQKLGKNELARKDREEASRLAKAADPSAGRK